MDRVYEGIVHWADVILVSTPIRWGRASSLYYKMVEQLNCIQNQETIANRHLLKTKWPPSSSWADRIMCRAWPDN